MRACAGNPRWTGTMLLATGLLLAGGFAGRSLAGPESQPVAGRPEGGFMRAAFAAGGATSPENARGDDEILGVIPADRWLGGPEGGLNGSDLRGDVVLVEFWTYLCYNCKNVEGWMKETHATYSPRGLRVIGVHTPEFDVEKKLENVRSYIRENGIEYPVAIDNGFRVWRKYNSTHAWPAFLVFDRQGKLVYRRAGERAVVGAKAAIEKALGEGKSEDDEAAARRSGGVAVGTAAVRTSPSTATLQVSFDPAPGYLLVKSPPNEVRLERTEGVRTPAQPVMLGEPFQGGNASDVKYYEEGASLEIPLEISEGSASRPVALHGSVVYHVCDKKTNVCSRQEASFTQLVEAS